jgi:hypothetical protein
VREKKIKTTAAKKPGMDIVVFIEVLVDQDINFNSQDTTLLTGLQ